MDHGIAALDRLGDELGVAQVALDLGEPGTPVLGEDVATVKVEIEDLYVVALGQELRNQHAADIAGATGHQHGPATITHSFHPIAKSTTDDSSARWPASTKPYCFEGR